MRSLDSEVEEQLEDGNAVAAGLFAIAAQLQLVAVQLKYLGNGDAATTMGAIEALGMHLGEKLEAAGQVIASAIEMTANE